MSTDLGISLKIKKKSRSLGKSQLSKSQISKSTIGKIGKSQLSKSQLSKSQLSKSKGTKRTHKIKRNTRSRERSAADKIIRFFRRTKHTRKSYHLKALCADSGVCLAFGPHADEIKKHFGGFKEFAYVQAPIKRIGQDSANGFVNQLEYKHRGYTSYAILKSSKESNADNLAYEYSVGLFINELNIQYPCFLETYGYYIYKDDSTWNKMQHMREITDVRILDGLELQKNVDYNVACEKSEKLAILIQHLKDIESLDDLSRQPAFIENDLMAVLFQMYAPLSKLKNEFTHYDLHLNNIYLYEPVPGKYIEYHYYLDNEQTQLVSFKSRYMLKIIDYGRSYFKDGYNGTDAKHLYETEICPAEECNEPEDERGTCGSLVGLSWLEELSKTKPQRQYYISSQQKNVSHDLLPLYRMRERNKAPFRNKMTPEMNDLLAKVVYGQDFGTKEQVKSGYPRRIQNVTDAMLMIKDYLDSAAFKAKNAEVYADPGAKLGKLTIYSGGAPMEWEGGYTPLTPRA